jgi:hypothetical protein
MDKKDIIEILEKYPYNKETLEYFINDKSKKPPFEIESFEIIKSYKTKLQNLKKNQKLKNIKEWFESLRVIIFINSSNQEEYRFRLNSQLTKLDRRLLGELINKISQTEMWHNLIECFDENDLIFETEKEILNELFQYISVYSKELLVIPLMSDYEEIRELAKLYMEEK